MKARKIRTMDREGNVVDVLGLKGERGANGQPGANGTTPHIGENGNWFIGDTDTGVPATGEGGGSGSGIIAETDPTVFVWAKSHLPFTVAQLSAMASGAGFVVNPTNFADGKTYFRYHAGTTSFTWTNPNPQRGAVTITVLAWSQYGDKTAANAFSALNIVYGDGTTGRLSLVNGQTVTMTTDANKVLTEIRGNYDHENWVLLDMSVLTIVADYPAPTGTVKSVNGNLPDEDGNVQIPIPEGGGNGTDANAVHYTAETPTEEQQMQARANLGLYWHEQVGTLIVFEPATWNDNGESTSVVLSTTPGATLNVKINGAGSGLSFLDVELSRRRYTNKWSYFTATWYGNGNLIADILATVYDADEYTEQKYPDVPFCFYNYDIGGGDSGWLFTYDTSIMTGDEHIGYSVYIYDLANLTDVYHPVPTEYLPALTGATSDTDGTSGLVPAPAAGDEGKFLAGDGTWKTPESSGGGTDLSLGVSGAAVGQTVRITAVDDSGKPTAWEAVDEIRRTVLCDFTAAEEVESPQIELSDNPFNYTTFIVDAKLTKPADGNPMFQMFLKSEDGRVVQISHLQTIATTSGTKLHGMVILAKDKAYSSFVKKADYQWNSTAHYSDIYPVTNYESYRENALKCTNSTLQAGDYIRIEGVRG